MSPMQIAKFMSLYPLTIDFSPLQIIVSKLSLKILLSRGEKGEPFELKLLNLATEQSSYRFDLSDCSI